MGCGRASARCWKSPFFVGSEISGWDWLESEASLRQNKRGWLDANLSAPVLGGVALAGLVAFSIVGCFAYYPAPKEVFEEMYILRGEVPAAVLSGNAGTRSMPSISSRYGTIGHTNSRSESSFAGAISPRTGA